MDNLGERIKSKRKELNLTQLEMGKLVGVSHVTISQWEHGETVPKSRSLNFLCKVLECKHDWLLYGTDSATELNTDISPLFNRAKYGYKVPLISWEMAYEWPEVKSSVDYSNFKIWRHTSVEIGKHGFAVVVMGDSMTNPSGFPSIPEGSIIIVEPDYNPKNNQIVLVKLLKYKEVTLKKYVIDGPNQYLVPLNPNYKTIEINNDCLIIGVILKIELDLV